MKKIFALIVMAFLAGNVFAQNVEFTKDNFKGQKDQLKDALNAIKGGDQYYEQGYTQYAWALPLYLHANEFNPNNAMLNYKIGLCYIYSAFKWKAQDFLLKAYKLNPNVAEDIHYYLGRAYHLGENWQSAVSEYNIYLQGLNPSKQADQ